MKFIAKKHAAYGEAGWIKSAVAAVAVITLLFSAAPIEAASKSAKPVPMATTPAPQGPLLVVVSISSQRLTVYDKNGRVLESPVSSGQSGFDTPQGVFSIIERNREHFSNLYNDAPMPNMQRITWSGVAMHAGNLPGYAASHGCIRLPLSVSARLFELTKLGTRVIVAQNDIAPVSFEHANLFSVRQFDTAPTIGADAVVPLTTSGVLGKPMMLGLPFSSAQYASTQQNTGDPFVDRPAGVTRAAWAAALTAVATPLEVAAKTAKAKAMAAEKDAMKAMSMVIASEHTRSRIAAKLDALEAIITRSSNSQSTARADASRVVVQAQLSAALADTDRLRAIEEPKRAAADLFAREADAAADARNVAGARARDAHRSLKPVSVFVSLKSNRIYVRQGFQPLFDAPIEIQDAAKPIGTHVFTAIDAKPDATAMHWSAISTIDQGAEPIAASTKRHRRRQMLGAPAETSRLTAAAALDRIKFPEDVRQRIGEMLIPGSSLIISDHGVSNETGKGTDFVILTK